MISIKHLATPESYVTRGRKVTTMYRGHIVAATVLMADYHNNRYVCQFKTPTTGLVVLSRKRSEITVIDDAVIVEEINIENEEAEEFVHLEMM